MTQWTAADIPDLNGLVTIVTGANSGLGYETTLALARHGAEVVMACRNVDRALAAADSITAQVPDARLVLEKLDLSSLESVHSFAGRFRQRYQRLDRLFNNAGLMAPPRTETADGFELQFGVNHLGHFALTGRLVDRLLSTPASRVVTTSSSAAYAGRINFDDLQGERRYRRYRAYSQSKLANLLFAFELQRRLEAAGSQTLSMAAHPGLSSTHLQARTARASGSWWERIVYPLMHAVLSQSPAEGALPQLYAGTAPDARGGAFYGPRYAGIRGAPVQVKPPPAAKSRQDAARLWQVSVELTGVDYRALGGPPDDN